MWLGRVSLTAAAVVSTFLVIVPAMATTESGIRQVRCDSPSTDFTIRYDGYSGEACFSGTGEISVTIPRVDQVSAGSNSGLYEARAGGSYVQVSFHAGEIFVPHPPDYWTILMVKIT